MKVISTLVLFLIVPTQADDLRKGPKPPNHGNGIGPLDPKSNHGAPPPIKHNDDYSKPDSNYVPPPIKYNDDYSKPDSNYNSNDDDTHNNPLSNFISSTSDAGAVSANGHDDMFIGNDDDSIPSNIYRTSKHSNSNSATKRTVDILFRPYGTACPRTINPSNVNKNSDKDFILVIFGASDFNVKNIEPYSIQLGGVSKVKSVNPVSWDYTDVGRPVSSSSDSCQCKKGSSDGIQDLIVRFKESSVAKIPEVVKAGTGDKVTLIIYGHTSSSSVTFFKGKDCIKVV